MEKREITKEHVAYLHEFCKKKDIRYVDLRIELVDHLCEMVKVEWQKNPHLSFRDAFHNVYRSYGIFGFNDVASEHEKTVQKRYWRELWLFFKKWITPPRVVLTIAVTLVVYFLLDFFPLLRKPLAIATALIYISSMVVHVVQFFQNKRILKEENILMGGSRQGFGWFFYFVYLFFLQPLTVHGNVVIIDTPWLITTLFMLVVLFSRANYLIMHQAKIQLEELKLKLA